MKQGPHSPCPGGVIAALVLAVAVAGCGSGSSASAPKGGLKVVATTSFLRDIAQNVAGKQFRVGELIPIGVDPHEWQPAPSDLVTVAKSDLVIVNGGGLEGTLLEEAQNAGGQAQVVIASQRPAPARAQARRAGLRAVARRSIPTGGSTRSTSSPT